MKGNQKYDNGRQLHIEDYLQENKLETKGNVEVPSILVVPSKEKIDTKTVTNELLEKILSKDNLNMAFKRVKTNKGASGIDDMKVDELLQYLKENGKQIKENIRNGKYNPKALRRVEIPKADGSKRKLGIPTVVDRVIQQAITQQLSNIMLNELDKELEKRGLQFVRYADDCVIFTKSKKSAERVMENITKFIETKLRLKVNREKSKVDRPWRIKYLGFSFYQAKEKIEIRIHPKSVAKFKEKIRNITSRSKAVSMESRYIKLKQVIVGWVNYFKIANMGKIAQTLDKWIRRRIRMCYWKRWKKCKTKRENLIKLGIPEDVARKHSGSRRSYWRMADTPAMHIALNNKTLEKLGYTSLTSVYC